MSDTITDLIRPFMDDALLRLDPQHTVTCWDFSTCIVPSQNQMQTVAVITVRARNSLLGHPDYTNCDVVPASGFVVNQTNVDRSLANSMARFAAMRAETTRMPTSA